jgi:hypothetical protein
MCKHQQTITASVTRPVSANQSDRESKKQYMTTKQNGSDRQKGPKQVKTQGKWKIDKSTVNSGSSAGSPKHNSRLKELQAMREALGHLEITFMCSGDPFPSAENFILEEDINAQFVLDLIKTSKVRAIGRGSHILISLFDCIHHVERAIRAATKNHKGVQSDE